MSSGKRLISGILGAILALGGVSAKRVSGKKIVIGGAVLSLPTAFLLWKLFKGGSKSGEGSLLGKKGKSAMAESEANPEVPSEGEILELLKLNSKCRVLKFLGAEGLKDDSKLCEEVKRMIGGFVVNVMSKKVGDDKLVIRLKFGIEGKGSIDISNHVELRFVDDKEKTDFEGIVKPMLRYACESWLCKELDRSVDGSSEQTLIDLMVPYFYITSGKQMVADLKERLDELGWY